MRAENCYLQLVLLEVGVRLLQLDFRYDEDVPQMVALLRQLLPGMTARRNFHARLQRAADDFGDTCLFQLCQNLIAISKKVRPAN